ncbi:monoacylglycerol lipase ABHD6 [Thamnophis elegans]|uniref:monoacylglycerol lipase ABHD6 n=1 Tax=Thamnophis elegans TaxID=35005 RepID=UPI00137690B7|nr:monoacylglycerol lipase ABHD6 [Thamnophis elegans]
MDLITNAHGLLHESVGFVPTLPTLLAITNSHENLLLLILAHNVSSPLITGLVNSKESNFIKQLREQKENNCIDHIPLIPSTPEEMGDMLKLCSYVRFKVPHQILQGLVDVRIPHNDFYRKLFLELMDDKSRGCLHNNMSKIKATTQIIWGKQDQVLDVSGADILAKSISGAQVHILENCGHNLVMERPRKTAKLILDFVTTVQNAENNKKLV